MKLGLAQAVILCVAIGGLIQIVKLGDDVRSAPNEIPNNIQSVDPEDLVLLESGGKAPVLKPPGLSIFIAGTGMNNNDKSLKKSGASGDREISIGVDPKNTNRVVISDVSGGPDATVLLWLSTDGGTTWTKKLTINSPRTSSVLGCPCDQAAEFAQFYSLTGAISKIAGSVGAYDNFNLQGFVPPVSQLAGLDIKEQPWLLTGRSTSAAGVLKSISVAHGDFSTALSQWAAVPGGIDWGRIANGFHRTGASVGVVNLGYRLASDPRSGALYSLFQRWRNAEGGDSQNINYMLNRSTDGGRTWELNGSPEGIVVANADSTQPLPKFCTVNATLGGADQAVVDQQTATFYVYGKRDPETGNNRLAVRRLSDDKHGGLAIGPEVFVTGQVQAAIPAVAITSNDTLGVFYYVCDGTSLTGFPILTAHFSVSTDQGNSFIDNALATFLSPAKDDGNPRQQVLGNYMQTKAVGDIFLGVFIGNGEPFRSSISSTHPVFYKVSVGRQIGLAR